MFNQQFVSFTFFLWLLYSFPPQFNHPPAYTAIAGVLQRSQKTSWFEFWQANIIIQWKRNLCTEISRKRHQVETIIAIREKMLVFKIPLKKGGNFLTHLAPGKKTATFWSPCLCYDIYTNLKRTNVIQNYNEWNLCFVAFAVKYTVRVYFQEWEKGWLSHS